MKILVLPLFLLVLSQNTLFAKTMVISDVDDTIKMTDVLGSKTQVVFNGVFRTKAFAGMSELYQEYNHSDTIIHYVSGSPRIIGSRVDNFLEENSFPQKYNLTLKESLKDDTYKYKVDAIKKLIAEEKPDAVVLIGDDTEKDPEVYNFISKENPELVKAIYIRAVQNRALPENPVLKNFFAAPELAAYEFERGEIDSVSVSFVTNAFIYNWGSGISIKGRYCPVNGRTQINELITKNSDERVTRALKKVQSKISNNCH